MFQAWWATFILKAFLVLNGSEVSRTEKVETRLFLARQVVYGCVLICLVHKQTSNFTSLTAWRDWSIQHFWHVLLKGFRVVFSTSKAQNSERLTCDTGTIKIRELNSTKSACEACALPHVSEPAQSCRCKVRIDIMSFKICFCEQLRANSGITLCIKSSDQYAETKLCSTVTRKFVHTCWLIRPVSMYIYTQE